MAERPSRPTESNTPKTVKDKKCQYCYRAFTSSSLGRHLDVFIRDKNPKAPDGVHDVEAIRKLRQNITRRQPRAAVARRDTFVSAGTPSTGSWKSPASLGAESPAVMSPLSGLGGRRLSLGTAVTNDGAGRVPGGEFARLVNGDGAGRGLRPAPPQRSVSRQILKQQLDMRHQMQDALDTSRAAELALRELISSLRAAKRKVDIGSMPFSFDPLSLDFPALTLQCLEPPPTLFSATQHPTLTSWSIMPPGPSQLEALHAYFKEKFQLWKSACASATSTVGSEPASPSSPDAAKMDNKDRIRKAEKEAERMERHVYEHVEATYSIWNGLAQEQREHLWKLELARCLGKKRQEVDKLEHTLRLVKQDNANLRAQLEQISRGQQPREFTIAPPSTVFVDEKLLDCMLEDDVSGKRTGGLNLTDDGNSDLNAVVSAAIGRWKNVILSTRSAHNGLGAQHQLDAKALGLSGSGIAGNNRTVDGSSTSQQIIQQQLQPSRPCPQNSVQTQSLSTAVTYGTRNPATTTSNLAAPTPSAATAAVATFSARPSISSHAGDDEDQEMSDRDAESDSEGKAGVNTGSHHGDAEGDADGDADDDAEGDIDADADAYADMDDPYDHAGYTEAQLQPVQQRPQQTQPMSTMQPRRVIRPGVPPTREATCVTPAVSNGRSSVVGGAAGGNMAVHGLSAHFGSQMAHTGKSHMMQGAGSQPMSTD